MTQEDLEKRIKELEEENTKLKVINSNILNNNDILKSIFDNFPGMINVIDTDYNVLMTNRKFSDVFDKIKDPIGMKCYNVHKGRNEICPECIAQKVIETKKPQERFSTQEEEELLSKSFRVYAFPQFEGKNLKSVVELVIDVSDIKASEIETRLNYNMIKNLIDSVELPLFYKDINKVYQGCNDAFCEFLGVRKEDIVGRSVYDLIDDKSKADFYDRKDEDFLSIVKENHDYVQEYSDELVLADKEKHEIFIHKSPYFDSNNNLLGFICSITDVSYIREKERLEGMIETIGAVCHNINNPLAGLLGYFDLLNIDIKSQGEDFDSFLNYLTLNKEKIENEDIYNRIHDTIRSYKKNYDVISEKIDKLNSAARSLSLITRKLQSVVASRDNIKYKNTDYAGNVKIADIMNLSDPE